MKGIIVTGGLRPEYDTVRTLFQDNAYVVAADSGLDFCRKNAIVPHYILGDMDSLESKEILKEYPRESIEEHPAEKDFTDTELAFSHLQSIGCTHITLLGGGGGRLDHLLAICALFDRDLIPDVWISHKEAVYTISDSYIGTGLVGEMISFFPIGTEECRMQSRGLYWPLDNLVWKKGDIGISNRLSAEEFEVSMKSGRLMMIRSLIR